MRAVVHDRYGAPDVLRIEDVERPVPKENEVLVRIHATTVNRTDTAFRSAETFLVRFFTGLLRPKQTIVGRELAGEVEAVGAAVTEFKVGDRVFGIRSGANAEFVCVRESGALAHMPAGMTFEEACGGLRRRDPGTGAPETGRCRQRHAHPRLRRLWILRNGSGAAGATRYVETQQKTGNVVLTVNGGRAQ